MKEKLLTLAVALLVATGAWAQTTFTAENLEYTVTDAEAKTVELTGYETKPEGALTIPATVTNESTEYSVTSIGSWAFSNCYSLTTVNIPASLTQMGDWVFDYCSALTAINVAGSNTAYCSENGILFNKDKTTLICYPAGKPQLEYTIPSSVTVIGVNAFAYCDALTQLTIPSSVTSIGEWAFDGCTALAEMTVLATVPPTVADADVFRNVDCNIPVYVPAASLAAYQAAEVWKYFNLQAIVTEFTVGGLTYNVIDQIAQTVEVINFTDELPSTVTIPATVSYGGKNYTVTAIASSAFYQNQTITEITISEGITSIRNRTFGRCFALTTVNIPASLTQMGDWVFDYCSALTAINVAGSNTAYCSENGILFNKDKTTLICYPAGKPQLEYTIPSSVTVIGVNAFAYCDALTQLTIPSSVTSIGEWAFDGCTALAEMTVLATVPPTVADADVFRNVDCNIPVYVPAESLTAYQNAEVWKEFNLQAMSNSAVTNPSMPESISMQNGTLHNPQQLHLTLYDMQGRQVYSGNDTVINQPTGVYVIRCADSNCKVLF